MQTRLLITDQILPHPGHELCQVLDSMSFNDTTNDSIYHSIKDTISVGFSLGFSGGMQRVYSKS